MMRPLVIVFLSLLAFQLVATVAYVLVYRHSDWKSTTIGRHLMFYSIAAGSIDFAWAMIVLFSRYAWLVYVLFAAQFVFGLLTWQRVHLVWVAQRESREVKSDG